MSAQAAARLASGAEKESNSPIEVGAVHLGFTETRGAGRLPREQTGHVTFAD